MPHQPRHRKAIETKTEVGGGLYRALVGLSWPADRDAVRRISAGEKLTPEERGPAVRVEAGEIARGLPEPSAGWLLAEGLIEFADEVGQGDPAGLPPELGKEGGSDG